MFLCSFPVQQTTYRIGNHSVYYPVWLRADRLMRRTHTQVQMILIFSSTFSEVFSCTELRVPSV